MDPATGPQNSNFSFEIGERVVTLTCLSTVLVFDLPSADRRNQKPVIIANIQPMYIVSSMTGDRLLGITQAHTRAILLITITIYQKTIVVNRDSTAGNLEIQSEIRSRVTLDVMIISTHARTQPDRDIIKYHHHHQHSTTIVSRIEMKISASK